jgi:hypothetical protein
MCVRHRKECEESDGVQANLKPLINEGGENSKGKRISQIDEQRKRSLGQKLVSDKAWLRRRSSRTKPVGKMRGKRIKYHQEDKVASRARADDIGVRIQVIRCPWQ